jgi:hypothetical protein
MFFPFSIQVCKIANIGKICKNCFKRRPTYLLGRRMLGLNPDSLVVNDFYAKTGASVGAE